MTKRTRAEISARRKAAERAAVEARKEARRIKKIARDAEKAARAAKWALVLKRRADRKARLDARLDEIGRAGTVGEISDLYNRFRADFQRDSDTNVAGATIRRIVHRAYGRA